MKKEITRTEITILLVLTSILIFSAPTLIRLSAGEPLLYGSEQHYALRLSKFTDSGFFGIDEMLVEPRPYILEPYHFLISLVSKAVGLTAVALFLPPLIGLFFILLVSGILYKLKFEKEHSIITGFVLLSSPIIIYSFSHSVTTGLSLFAQALAFYLFIKNKKITSLFSKIVFFLIPFFGISSAFVSFAMLATYASFKKKWKQTLPYFVLVFISLCIYLVFFFKLDFNISFLLTGNFIQAIISDFGSKHGIAFFSILLALVGFFITRKKKFNLVFLYFALALLFLNAYLFERSSLAYIMFFISPFVSIALLKLYKMRWDLHIIKNLTLIVLACGLLFSAVAYLNLVKTESPSSEQFKSLAWLSQFSAKDAVILTHFSNGFLVESISQRRVLLDPLFFHTSNAEQLYSDSNLLFESRNLQNTKQIINKYNITYIWINQQMKSGLVWEGEEDGLLFLFRNNETFKKVYSSSEVEIWRVLE